MYFSKKVANVSHGELFMYLVCNYEYGNILHFCFVPNEGQFQALCSAVNADDIDRGQVQLPRGYKITHVEMLAPDGDDFRTVHEYALRKGANTIFEYKEYE